MNGYVLMPFPPDEPDRVPANLRLRHLCRLAGAGLVTAGLVLAVAVVVLLVSPVSEPRVFAVAVPVGILTTLTTVLSGLALLGMRGAVEGETLSLPKAKRAKSSVLTLFLGAVGFTLFALAMTLSQVSLTTFPYLLVPLIGCALTSFAYFLTTTILRPGSGSQN